ncbi:Nucleoporin Nup54, alpha-helical domain-containing protein [Artemisia annua]|uniref:Nucleoporin Nup54, alpha-helical domain-containing protein n=1 Tax=Artemisia annua TaxID=35608 RepID=A0A2U1LZ67_ARTAN|nr:Nucleoporin Nup54, alpha-helical domain-containing protein [Artemisia annua]
MSDQVTKGGKFSNCTRGVILLETDEFVAWKVLESAVMKEHLLFSVTEPQHRAKPAGVSDIMWAEAMGKLEGMESSIRERFWSQLVKGFKDLSERLKLMRILEALEAKGFRLPLNKEEVNLADKLATIIRQLKGFGAELLRRVQNLLTASRVQGNGHGGASVVLQRQIEAVARLGNVLK